MSLHNRLLATAIIGRIILLTLKFAFLLVLKKAILKWLKKPIDPDSFTRQALTLFGLGIIHVSNLLIFRRNKILRG